MDEFQKPDKLNKVERDLYSRNSDIQKKDRDKFNQDEYDVPQKWADEINNEVNNNPLKRENQKRMTWFSKILIGAFIFFLAALSYAFYIFQFNPDTEGQDVDIKINSPVSVAAGEEFTFDIVIENNNALEMESIDLLIEYPEGTRSGDDISQSLPRERSDIGSVGSGTFLRESRNVYLFGEEGDTKKIDVKIVYRIKDSNAVFEKRKNFEVLLRSTPVRVNVNSVKEITSGQDINFELEVISNSNEVINNLILKAEYPFGFIFNDSNLETNNSNNVWLIEKLEPNEKIVLEIKGRIEGQNNDLRYFRFDAGLANEAKDDIEVIFTSIGKELVIERPFLEIDIAIRDDNSSIFNLSSLNSHRMDIEYKNNTGSVIDDAQIELKIDGGLINEFSLANPGGFYDSNTKTIYWDGTTSPALSQMTVGESGAVSVNFNSFSLTGSEIYKNPEVNISAIVKGNRFQDNDVPEEIENEIFKTIRFNTVALVDDYSLYYDGPFENSGPIPPTVGEETTYTIFFEILNSSNTLSGTKVEMSIPNYVEFKNQIWPIGANISFDEKSRKLIWDIGEIKGGTGFNNDKTSAAFQVSIRPSISQRGISVVLAEGITLVGTDLFTGEQISTRISEISTTTADQRNFEDGKVTQ